MVNMLTVVWFLVRIKPVGEENINLYFSVALNNNKRNINHITNGFFYSQRSVYLDILNKKAFETSNMFGMFIIT